MEQWDTNSVAQRLRDRLKSLSEDKDILYYGNNSRIIDAVSEEFQEFSRYDEYLTAEAKWETARNYSSILSQSDFYNYKARRRRGSSGGLKISTSQTFDGDYPVSIDILKYSAFSNKDIFFVAKENRILSPGQNYITIDIVQGIPIDYTFEITSASYPDGTEYIELQIDNPDIENTVYDLFVNGIPWTEIDHIRLAETGVQLAYVVKNKKDFSGIMLLFGNGIFGKKLEIGDVVSFKCLETKGEWSNILASNNVTKVESSFVDANSVPVTLYCSNTDVLTGGDTYESKTEIKVNAPRSYQTGDRAISRLDYETIILRSGLVDKVSVWGEKEVNEDQGNPPGTYLPQEENLVYISAFNIDPITGIGTPITEATKSDIRDLLNEVKGPTDIIQFVDTEFIGVIFNTIPYVSDKSYTLEQVRSNIDTSFTADYALEQVGFRQNLYFSDYYALVDNTEGVNHHRTTLSFNSPAKFLSSYVFNLELNLNNIKPSSVKIYLNIPNENDEWFIIAEDDGSTNLIGTPTNPNDPNSPPYELPGAKINYADGFGGEIIVTYGLSEAYSNYSIKIDFKIEDSEEGDLLLTKRQQIFSYYEASINPIATYNG